MRREYVVPSIAVQEPLTDASTTAVETNIATNRALLGEVDVAAQVLMWAEQGFDDAVPFDVIIAADWCVHESTRTTRHQRSP